MLRFSIASILLASILGATMAPAALANYGDPLADDLGFTTGLNSMRTGTIFRRAFSVQDADVSFIINNVPLLYHAPRNRFAVAACEERFERALENARANSQHEWRSLALLLEGAAAFYRKLNRSGDSLMLLTELVDLLSTKAPGSIDLSEAQIALAQTATAEHQYAQAEQAYQDALTVAANTYGTHHTRIAEIHSYMYFLYLDMGRTDLAVKERRESLAASRADVVALQDKRAYHQNSVSWPSIIKSIDGVATTQEIADAEREADRVAQAALAKYRAGIDPTEEARREEARREEAKRKEQSNKGKKKNEKDETDAPPPLPYRTNSGLSGR
jgi:tetratricopeptide (TPR) repeat protein